jgi:hypothetical protein
VIGSIDEAARDDYTEKWENIEDTLGRDSFQELFGHIRMIFRKAKPKGTLEREFLYHVNPLGSPRTFIDGTLAPLSKAFQTVKDASYPASPQSDKINSALRWLSRIDNTDWLPPTISYFDRYYNNPELLLTFTEDLERLTYGLFILRTYVNERISRYSRLQSEIDGNSDLRSPGSSLQLSEWERQGIKNALGADIYSMVKVRLPVLLRLDAAYSDGAAQYTQRIITVEHVLPQNPSADSEWLTTFPDPAERLHFTNQLANLVLLSREKNSKAQNYDFERKKQEYFLSGSISTFALTSQVLAQPIWTPNVLKTRQNQLIAKLCQIWRLD